MIKPKIRFKGYQEEWEQRKLSEVVDSVDTGKSRFNKEGSSGEYPILGSTSVIGYDDEYDYEGDFILTARVGANAGSLYRHAGKVKISDNTVFIQASQNIEFLYQLLIQFDIKKLSFGTGQPLVKASELKSLELMMPTDMKEQMRIGVYFKNLDHLITLHHRKCEEMKILKKYMLQKMFPQNGNSVPEIRFLGFTEDWEQRKVSEITSSYSGGTPKAGTTEYYDGDIPFIRSGEIYGNTTELFITEEGLNSSSAKMVHIGDILYALYGATSGEVSRAKLDGAINQAILAIIPNDEMNADFLVEWFRKEKTQITDKYLQGGQGNLSAQIIKDLIVTIPTCEEQNKIGEYFSKINHLITLHQKKCDELRNIKKFMLQNIFI